MSSRTRGIALMQHPNEACYITSGIRVGKSNHSTTVSATPDRYENHGTFALGYQHAKEHTVCQQLLHARSLYMPTVLFGFTGGRPRDWNLAFVLREQWLSMSAKCGVMIPFVSSEGKVRWFWMSYWTFLNVLLQLCVLNSSHCHRFPQIEEA